MIAGALDSLSMDVMEFYPFYNTTTTAKDIKSRMAFLSPIIISYCNEKLDDGLYIPVPESLKKYIKNQKIYNKNGYLLMDADIDFRSFDVYQNDTQPNKDINKTDDSSDNNDINTNDDDNNNSNNNDNTDSSQSNQPDQLKLLIKNRL